MNARRQDRGVSTEIRCLSQSGERGGNARQPSKTLERSACRGREGWVLKGKVARSIISNRERDRARTGTLIGVGIRAI